MSHIDEATWLEETFNRITQKRWSWFPMHSMQPAPNEFVSVQKVLTIILLSLVPAATIGSVGIYFYTRWLGLWHEAALIAAVIANVFSLAGAVNYQYCAAHFWNRRARRLQLAGDLPADETSPTGAEKKTSLQHNPFAAPEVMSVAMDASRPAFPLNRSLLLHEVFFCHGSLLVWSLLCLRGFFRFHNLPAVAQSYRTMGVVSLLQGAVLAVLTVSLATRQSWLGRRTFFVLKLAFGIGQIAFVLYPADQHLLRSVLLPQPVDNVLLIWFGACGVLTLWSAVVQYRQPEDPVQPLFGRNPVRSTEGVEKEPEGW